MPRSDEAKQHFEVQHIHCSCVPLATLNFPAVPRLQLRARGFVGDKDFTRAEMKPYND